VPLDPAYKAGFAGHLPVKEDDTSIVALAITEKLYFPSDKRGDLE